MEDILMLGSKGVINLEVWYLEREWRLLGCRCYVIEVCRLMYEKDVWLMYFD